MNELTVVVGACLGVGALFYLATHPRLLKLLAGLALIVAAGIVVYVLNIGRTGEFDSANGQWALRIITVGVAVLGALALDTLLSRE